jgi:hypothetical protein
MFISYYKSNLISVEWVAIQHFPSAIRQHALIEFDTILDFSLKYRTCTQTHTSYPTCDVPWSFGGQLAQAGNTVVKVGPGG